MSKYHRNGLTASELRAVADLMDFIDNHPIGQEGYIDHVQIRSLGSDNPDNIAGKIGSDDTGALVYLARKEKK